jgi:NitT/TauT family transport system substrate-binding protein
MMTGAQALHVAVLVLACAALGCRSGPADRLVLAETQVPETSLPFVAADRGFYAAEGLEVRRVPYAVGRDAMAALIAGEADVATCYTTPFALRAFAVPGLRAITTLHSSRTSTRLLARRDRNIRTSADLRGKRIGVPRGTSAEFFLETLLTFDGIRLQEVELVDLAPAAAPEAFAKGTVDAVAVWQPLLERAARSLPASDVVEFTSDLYTEMSLVATREDVLRSKPAALRKLVAALARAQALAREDPEAVPASLARAFPGERPEDLRALSAGALPRIGVPNLLLLLLDRESDWFLRSGRASGQRPDFQSMVVTTFLDEVAPETVTWIHVSPSPP